MSLINSIKSFKIKALKYNTMGRRITRNMTRRDLRQAPRKPCRFNPYTDVFQCLNEGLFKGPSARNGPYIVYFAYE